MTFSLSQLSPPALPSLLLSSSAQSLSPSVTVACVFLSLLLPATYRYCIDQTRAQTHAHTRTHWASHSFHHWFALFCSAFFLSPHSLSPSLSPSLSCSVSTAALVDFNPWRIERGERNREIMTGRQREAFETALEHWAARMGLWRI